MLVVRLLHWKCWMPKEGVFLCFSCTNSIGLRNYWRRMKWWKFTPVDIVSVGEISNFDFQISTLHNVFLLRNLIHSLKEWNSSSNLLYFQCIKRIYQKVNRCTVTVLYSSNLVLCSVLYTLWRNTLSYTYRLSLRKVACYSRRTLLLLC